MDLNTDGRGTLHLEHLRLPNGHACELNYYGTFHSTQESCQKLREVIQMEKPQTVILELCPEWFELMVDEQNSQVQTVKDLLFNWIQGNKSLLDFLYCWYLLKRGGAKKLLTESEYMAAYMAARGLGAKVVLGSPPLKETLARLWASITIREKASLAYSLVSKILFFRSGNLENEHKGIDDEDIEVLKTASPLAYQTIMNERRTYMMQKLWVEAEQCSSLVAVLEGTHLKYYKYSLSNMSLVALSQGHGMPGLIEDPPVRKRKSTVKIMSLVGAVIAIFSGIFVWSKIAR